jgi:hypothetical protein
MTSWMQQKARYYYLDHICAVEYPEQAPECEAAKWYHLLLWCVPLFGIHIMSEAIDARARRLGITRYH